MKPDARSNVPLSSIKESHRSLFLAIGHHLGWQRGKAYLVGGYIRDLLLGISPSDIDIVVSQTEPRVLAQWIHKQFGFSHPVRFKRFRTFHIAREDLELEIAPMAGRLADDARRRDFTINCLYVDLASLTGSSFKVIDPTGLGLFDVSHRVLRTPAQPLITFYLDPLRLLRGIRFKTTLGMKTERGLENQIARLAYLVTKPAPERIRTELEKILLSNRVSQAFGLMHRTGLLKIILPEIDAMAGYSQHTPFHSYDLLEHTLRTVRYTPPVIALRLSALFHDVGKPSTCRRLPDRNIYYGHARVSAELASNRLARLRFPKRTIAKVAFLISNHMVNYSSSWTDRAVRRFMRKMGDNLSDMLVLLEADRRAQVPDRSVTANIAELRRRIEKLRHQVPEMKKLPVDGHVIMEVLGIDQGPLVGEAKQFLEEVIERQGRPLGRDESIRLLMTWMSRRAKQSY